MTDDPTPDAPALAAPPAAPAAPAAPPAGPNIKGAIAFAAKQFGVDPNVLAGMAMKESGLRPDVISGKTPSSAGAIGLMQFMPDTAKDMGIDPTNPVQSVFGAAAYLSDHLKQFGGDYGKALAAYNWGPNREALKSPDWQSKLPAETRDYVDFVSQFAQAMGSKNAPVVTPGAGRGFVNPTAASSLPSPQVDTSAAPDAQDAVPDAPAVDAMGSVQGAAQDAPAPPDAGAGRGFVNPPDVSDQATAPQGPPPSLASAATGVQYAIAGSAYRVVQGLKLEYADATGDTAAAEEAKRNLKSAGETQAENTPTFDSKFGQMAYSGLTGLVTAAPILAVGAVNPAIGLGLFAGQAQAEGYGKYRGRGASPAMAALGGTIEGGIMAATAYLPLSFVADKIGQVGVGSFISGLVARDVPTMVAQGVANDMVDTAIANPKKTWGDFIAEQPAHIAQSVVSAGIFSAGMGSAHASIRASSAVADRMGTPSQQFGRAMGQDVDAGQFSPDVGITTINPNLARQSAAPITAATPAATPAADPIHTILNAGSVEDAIKAGADAIAQLPDMSAVDRMSAILGMRRPMPKAPLPSADSDIATPALDGPMQQALRNAGLARPEVTPDVGTSNVPERLAAGGGDAAGDQLGASVAGPGSEPAAIAGRVDAAAAEPVQGGRAAVPVGDANAGDAPAVAPTLAAQLEALRAAPAEALVLPSLADRVEALRAAPVADTADTAPVSTLAQRIEALRAPEVQEQHAVGGQPTHEVPIGAIKLSNDVPQFKSDSDANGVVEPLGGSFDRTGVAPIQLWRRDSGQLEVISGRHRLDLAKRSGENTMPAQIHDESAGFDPQRAASLDAELNIRDGQGKVADYVSYFRNAGITEAEANDRGLLSRAAGKRGFVIAHDGDESLIAAHRAGQVSDEAAYAIARTAPGDGRLQSVGIRAVLDGKPVTQAANTMRAVKLMAGDRPASTGDMFGFDDSAMREAEQMAKIASAKQRAIGDRVAAITGAARRPELARAEGINVGDPKAILRRADELKQERAAWDNWSTNHDLVSQIRAEMQPVDTGAHPAEAAGPTPEQPVIASARAERPAEQIELRKRVSVLRQLLECI